MVLYQGGPLCQSLHKMESYSVSRIPGLFEIWIQNPWTSPYRALYIQSGIVLGWVPCLCTQWSALWHLCKWQPVTWPSDLANMALSQVIFLILGSCCKWLKCYNFGCLDMSTPPSAILRHLVEWSPRLIYSNEKQHCMEERWYALFMGYGGHRSPLIF